MTISYEVGQKIYSISGVLNLFLSRLEWMSVNREPVNYAVWKVLEDGELDNSLTQFRNVCDNSYMYVTEEAEAIEIVRAKVSAALKSVVVTAEAPNRSRKECAALLAMAIKYNDIFSMTEKNFDTVLNRAWYTLDKTVPQYLAKFWGEL